MHWTRISTPLRENCFTPMDGHTMNQLLIVSICYGLLEDFRNDVEKYSSYKVRNNACFVWPKHDKMASITTVDDISTDMKLVPVSEIFANITDYLNDIDFIQYYC